MKTMGIDFMEWNDAQSVVLKGHFFKKRFDNQHPGI